MEIRIERSNRKSLVLCLDRAGNAVVRAPLRTTEAEIAAFVKRHERWLARRLAERTGRELDLSDGAKVSVFGREYTVVSGRARLAKGTLSLPKEGREEAFIRLLKRETAEKMGELTAQLAAEYGYTYSAVRVSSARGRWGSCSARGTISYTFRLALLPAQLSYYVAVHELCHTRHLDHSPAFWREVEKILPGWKADRKALKSYSYLTSIL